MKKKKLLGKIVSLVLAAALTVTALPTTGMEVQAAEQVTMEGEATENESAQEESEEKSEEAQSEKEEKTSEAEKKEETENSEQDDDKDVPEKDDSVKSPVVENGKVTFNYYGHDKEQEANRVTVKGSMDNWKEHDMTYNASTGYWSVSLNNIAPGEYQYGFNYYGEEKTEWTLDPLNPNHVGDAGSNNVFWVEGLVSGNADVKKGDTVNLPKTLKCYAIDESTGKGTATDAEVTYALSAASEVYADKVALDNSGDTPTIKIASDLSTDVKELKLTATSKDNSDYTSTVTITVVHKEYTEDPELKSPVVGKGKATFYFFAPTAKLVAIKGQMTGSTWPTVPMTFNEETGYWTITLTVPKGTYEYGFEVDGQWSKDPLNPNPNGNSFFEITEASDKVSPVIEGNKVTFKYEDDKAESVALAGEMNGWDKTKNLMQKESETSNVWSLTLEDVKPGKYTYKFVVDGEKWITDPLNSNKVVDGDNANSVFWMEGLADGKAEVTSDGEANELPKTLEYYTVDKDTFKGTAADQVVTYTLSEETKKADYADQITLTPATESAGPTVSLKDGFPKDVTSFTLTATDTDNHTSTVTIDVVAAKYKYTIYYYDQNHTVADEAALWLWENGGAPGAEYLFAGSEELSDGNTWLKAEIDVSYVNLGFKAKAKGSWAWEGVNCTFVNKDKAKEVTLYIIADDNKVYTELPEITEQEDRYLVVEYKRNDGSARDWYFYTWNSGFGSNVFAPFEEINGTWTAKVPVKPGLTSISYCIERKGEQEKDGKTVVDHWAEKDGNDYTCAMPEDQTVVKIVMEEGKGITRTYPYNLGYELAPKDKTIHFYYRNNDKFLAGETDQYDSVEVEINGKEYPMTFNEADQRYTYDLADLEAGTYKYRYILKETAESEETYELDRYNEKKVTEKDVEYSVVEYGSFNPVISASVYRDSMDYNDNNVLTVKIDAEKEDDIKGMEVAKATADLSALGGSSEAEIDPELLELTIAVKQGVEAGSKTIPVTVYDQFQNEYTAETTVTVTERAKGNDFDWDEAVIYFAVTDRFFDGNSSNNGAGYDKSENGSSSYHGGDFAGLTQKLDYLKELGVNTIWITPIVANDMEDGLATDVAGIKSWGYHGYWASDFDKLDSHLGTEEEFATLLDEAHNRGMKIMVDVVLNHSGYDQEEKFNNMIKDEDGNPIPMIRDDSQMVSGSDQKYSLSGLPDFLTENKEVRELLVEWQSNWISKYPIDYYRVDTVKHVDDTTWSAFKNALTKINPKFKMIGEWAGAGYATDTGMLGTGRMDSLLDFDFNDQAQSFANGNISGVENFLQGRNAALNNTATLGQFMSSHDEDGLIEKLISQNKIAKDRAMELFKVAASLQITAKGQPVIYYGEELGQYGANNYPYQTNRYDFDWSKANDDNDMLTHYKKLLSIRNQYSEVFAKGSRNTIDANNDEKYDIFARSYAGTTLYVGLNNAQSENTVSFTVPAGVYCDLYSNTFYNTENDGTITVTIPAAKDGGTVILVASERGINVDEIPAQIYTGSEIKLSAEALKVRNGAELLTAGKDYTVDYKSNINVGTATVIIKGKGNYTDQLTAEFTILPKNIGEADVTLTYTDKLVYNKKKAQNAAPKLKYGKITLKENKDYTVVYYNSKEDKERTNPLSAIKEVGNYVMVITAKENSNYTGSIVVEDITIANKTLIKGASVKLSASSVSYKDCLDGNWPTVKELKVKGKVIDSASYGVEYEWNGSVGTATAIITIIDDGSEYMGSVSKTFKVTGEALKTVAVVNKDTIKNVIFDKAAAKTDAGITQENPALKAKAEGVTLVAGKDYTVSYKNNKKAGTATVTFTGIGAYTGSLTATFKILVKELKEDDTKLSVNCASEAVYAKSGSKPAITVSYDGVALDASDFKVVYKNNTKVTDNAQAIITFQGSYKGKVTKNFRIGKNTLADMTVTAKDVMYNKKPGKTFATPVVKDPQGKTLSAGKDFDKKYQYTYVNATTVKNNGQDVARAAGAQVDAKDIVPVGAQIRVTVVAAQNGNYVGENSTVYHVMAGNIANASIKIADKSYTGYAVTLKAEDFKQIKLNGVTYKVTEINGNQITLSGTGNKAIEGGLEIVSYTNNVNKGTAKITLKGTGDFGGTVTKTFRIKAKTAKNDLFSKLTSIFSR